MKLGVIFFTLIPILSLAQKGIQFEEGLSWQQVKAKAKTENKYIFVDCFATWCGPCKEMDKTVYPMDSVGVMINQRFISVRVQCDTSKKDNDAVKGWYADAHDIVSRYDIRVYPTFLFFSPDGEVVHKGAGYQNPSSFVTLARDAMDPAKQYYTLLRNYREGKKDYATMPYLAKAAMKFDDKDLAHSIAADYMHNHLDKLADAEFGTRENIGFFTQYRKDIHWRDRIVGWFLHQPERVDSIMQQKGYAHAMINSIAYNEEIVPRLAESATSKSTPDWDAIGRAIRKEFGQEFVDGNLLTGKVYWYRGIEDWRNYTHFLVMKLGMDSVVKAPKSPFNGMVLNNNAWEVFQHSDQKQELETALAWSSLAIGMYPKPDGNAFDTRANLLYKLGRKDEALAMEAKAVALAPKAADILDRWQKMKDGKPTW